MFVLRTALHIMTAVIWYVQRSPSIKHGCIFCAALSSKSVAANAHGHSDPNMRISCAVSRLPGGQANGVMMFSPAVGQKLNTESRDRTRTRRSRLGVGITTPNNIRDSNDL